jgi:hypothetical protein
MLVVAAPHAQHALAPAATGWGGAGRRLITHSAAGGAKGESSYAGGCGATRSHSNWSCGGSWPAGGSPEDVCALRLQQLREPGVEFAKVALPSDLDADRCDRGVVLVVVILRSRCGTHTSARLALSTSD